MLLSTPKIINCQHETTNVHHGRINYLLIFTPTNRILFHFDFMFTVNCQDSLTANQYPDNQIEGNNYTLNGFLFYANLFQWFPWLDVKNYTELVKSGNKSFLYYTLIDAKRIIAWACHYLQHSSKLCIHIRLFNPHLDEN